MSGRILPARLAGAVRRRPARLHRRITGRLAVTPVLWWVASRLRAMTLAPGTATNAGHQRQHQPQAKPARQSLTDHSASLLVRCTERPFVAGRVRCGEEGAITGRTRRVKVSYSLLGRPILKKNRDVRIRNRACVASETPPQSGSRISHFFIVATSDSTQIVPNPTRTRNHSARALSCVSMLRFRGWGRSRSFRGVFQ